VVRFRSLLGSVSACLWLLSLGLGASELVAWGTSAPFFVYAIAISVSRDSFISSDLAKKKPSGTIEQLGKDSVKTIRLV
jgi:hypothetical protein